MTHVPKGCMPFLFLQDEDEEKTNEQKDGDDLKSVVRDSKVALDRCVGRENHGGRKGAVEGERRKKGAPACDEIE